MITYPRARLLLGISCVGTLVVLAAIALLWRIPHHVLPSENLDIMTESGYVAAFIGITTLVLLSFDVLGGLVLPRRFGASDLTTMQFVRRWSRGVLTQAAILVGVLLLYRFIYEFTGIFGVIVAFAIFQLLLTAGQLAVARIVSGIQVGSQISHADSDSAAFRLSVSEDNGFSGGISGLPGCETTIFPTLWRKRLSASLFQTAIARRFVVISSGSRLRGLLAAISWNTAIFSLAVFLPGGGVDSVAALITSYFYCLLLSFVGLLILPTLSRRGVHEVDQKTAMVRSPAEVEAAAVAIGRLTNDEPSRSKAIESVFHPIPCVENRIRTLGSPAIQGAWNVARMTLFLSWAFGGPLARAVHCNLGRPDLWVFLPVE